MISARVGGAPVLVMAFFDQLKDLLLPKHLCNYALRISVGKSDAHGLNSLKCDE
jgi:hypothetical protein